MKPMPQAVDRFDLKKDNDSGKFLCKKIPETKTIAYNMGGGINTPGLSFFGGGAAIVLLITIILKGNNVFNCIPGDQPCSRSKIDEVSQSNW